MDRMDIINAWLNKTAVQIPELGECFIQDVSKEDGSGYSFILLVLVIGMKGAYGVKRKVYVNARPGRNRIQVLWEATV